MRNRTRMRRRGRRQVAPTNRSWLIPTPTFSGTPTTGAAPLTVQFAYEGTRDPQTWAWDFGDGATSTEQHPQHTYAAPGTFDVQLTVRNTAGTGGALKVGYITVT